jgi:hypothetical protein
MHYSAMTGKKPNNGKMAFDQFEIDNKQTILACPEKQKPNRTSFNEQDKTLSAL